MASLVFSSWLSLLLIGCGGTAASTTYTTTGPSIPTTTGCRYPAAGAGTAPQLPADYLWGCQPGYLCIPRSNSKCGLRIVPPASITPCKPGDCIPAPQPPPPQGYFITNGKLQFAQRPSLYYNLDPLQWGITPEVLTYYRVIVDDSGHTTSILLSPTAAPSRAKRDSWFEQRSAQTGPSQCYPTCNQCLYEAQSQGLTTCLAAPDSDFNQCLQECRSCISSSGCENSGDVFSQLVQSPLQPIVDYVTSVQQGTTSQTPPVTSSTSLSQPTTTVTSAYTSTSESPVAVTTPPPSSAPSSPNVTVPAVTTTATSRSTAAVPSETGGAHARDSPIAVLIVSLVMLYFLPLLA